MNTMLLLVPMALCLTVFFTFLGFVLVRAWHTSKVFYPKAVIKLQKKLLEDKTGQYFYRRYSTWCSVAGGKIGPLEYAAISLIGSILGFLLGLLSGNAIVSLTLFLLLLLTPSLILYARYTLRVNQMVKSFGQFVDLFARYYNSRKNIVLTFREMVPECPKELQQELIILNNKLSDGGNSIQAVESFAERLNHHWAFDFATYIISGLEGETADIQSALIRLTNEMFMQQDEKEERNSEIYAIWISLLAVIAICILLIPYNQTLLKESYRLYFFTPDGQALLSLAATIWFFSILLAFIWGRRNG
ncbi:type II secretion system F family protein [Brevibacillus fulvus]|uniref:Type II secretion system protein GspF domain-containing protein n=1 Tax=Brevibacillus fulvus TaxID=1125967 RepID=A0A939BTY0_9BACL|nr:hypothetical protein [Brevibacillus fulvus]MBM7592307.1 hypothetical protein [Brevibacillus fulvus]